MDKTELLKAKKEAVRYPLIKPKDKRILVINLRSGRIRTPRVGEIGVIELDPYSNPSLEDGDLIAPKRGDKKNVKKNRKVKL